MEAYCLFGFIVCIVSMMILVMGIKKRVNELNQKLDKVYNRLTRCYWESYNDLKTLESIILELKKAMNKDRDRNRNKK